MAKPDTWFMKALLTKALNSRSVPRRTGVTTWEWDVAGGCQSPVAVERYARPPSKRSSTQTGSDGSVWFRGADEPTGLGVPLTLLMWAPCRKCTYCLRRRGAQWRDRARFETEIAQRTWFCTWTLSPERQYHFLSEARAALSAQATDFEEISPEEQFQRVCWRIGRRFTLGLKRLRKNTGARVRYLIVAERHKSGAPHFHGLIHEQHGSPAVTHAALKRDLWHYSVGKEVRPEGFVNYKLADPASAAYVTKYLTKSAEARVRASIRYGKPIFMIEPREWVREHSTPCPF